MKYLFAIGIIFVFIISPINSEAQQVYKLSWSNENIFPVDNAELPDFSPDNTKILFLVEKDNNSSPAILN